MSAGVFVGPIVAFAGKVDPLWVTEFVAYEVEPSFATYGHREHANHFMQREAAIDDVTLVFVFHHGVHFFVHEPEGEGFVSYEGLVVGLCVGNCFFTVAAVGELSPDGFEIPLFVGGVLEEFDPVVWDAHSETVIKAESTVLRGFAAAWHSGKIFCDGEGLRVDFADEGVGQLKVGECAPVHSFMKVFVVVVEGVSP